MKKKMSLLYPTSWNPRTWFNKNFHVVDQGRCYRSKTLDKKSLEWVIKEHGIKTILNVREDDSSAQWYKDEIETAQKHGVELISVPLNGRATPSKQHIDSIVHVFQNSKSPLLIHCQAGADRTGFVAGLWEIVMNGSTLQKALKQLSIFRGHYQFVFPKMKKALREFHRSYNKSA